jgi:hypothetical protein
VAVRSAFATSAQRAATLVVAGFMLAATQPVDAQVKPIVTIRVIRDQQRYATGRRLAPHA